MKELLFVILVWLIMAAIVLGMIPFTLNVYVKLKRWKQKRKTDRKIEIIKRQAENHGLKIKEIKTDGYNVQIILCDETPPREGGHSNEQS